MKFKFRKEKLVLEPEFYLFHEFTKVWKADRTRDKKKAHKIFYFIWLLTDLGEENPLVDIPAETKEKEALFRAFSDKNHKFSVADRKNVEAAIECYVKHTTTPEERILISFDAKAEELRDLLERTKPETVENTNGGIVEFKSNTGIITGGLRELDTIKKQKINVIAAVRKQAMTQRVRGQVVLSPLSKGNIEIVPEADLYEQYGTTAISGESDDSQKVDGQEGLSRHLEEK